MMHINSPFNSRSSFMRAPLAALLLGTSLLGSGLPTLAQTPAAPTPTTPPSGINPPAPVPAPLPTFTPAPPMAAPAPARPLATPAPSSGLPGNRPNTPRVDCSDKANARLPICNQHKDTGIQRTPSTRVDPEFSKTPPPTGDGVAKGAPPEPPRVGKGDRPVEGPGAAMTPPTKKGVKAESRG
jgi:hypothetical protein